jgi:hypothetical protein
MDAIDPVEVGRHQRASVLPDALFRDTTDKATLLIKNGATTTATQACNHGASLK